ncbi:hypothetical protein [Microbacterium sp. A84]|uniref:hypothetical protein n=1 Tax=Microbacterium sp. A84 TaxID=3450715 RepID=UPI003F43483B
MSRRVPADYPGKKYLTESEQNKVLASGPDPKWFEPWAERGVHMTDATKYGYGYIHVHSTHGSFNYDFAAWDTKEGLGRGLEDLWERHQDKPNRLDSYPKCEGCQGVVYFMPDEPLHLRLVVELDDEGEDDQ